MNVFGFASRARPRVAPFKGASLVFARAKKSKQKKARPCIRGWSLRDQTSLTPALLRGHATKGRPCPFVTRSASMPRDPPRNACARPPEGEWGAVPTAMRRSLHRDHRYFANASVIRGRSGREQGPLRRPSGVGLEVVERHGRRESSEGAGTPFRSGPLEGRWSEGTPAQPGPDVGCAFSLVTFSLHTQRESDSPSGAKPGLISNTDAETSLARQGTEQ